MSAEHRPGTENAVERDRAAHIRKRTVTLFSADVPQGVVDGLNNAICAQDAYFLVNQDAIDNPTHHVNVTSVETGRRHGLGRYTTNLDVHQGDETTPVIAHLTVRRVIPAKRS